MDKKVRNRILYIAVAGLWGIAIYRTYKNYQVKKENDTVVVSNQPNISPMQFNKDTFELDLPFKDPFLGAAFIPTVNENSEPKNNLPKNNIKKEEIKPVEKKWPQIQYFGFVKNREKNSPLCLLKIDGQQIHISKGQSHNGILVMNTFKDSVQVVYEGERRVIRK